MRLRGLLCRWPSITEWEMHITAQGPCLWNDLYCVEWDVLLYYIIPSNILISDKIQNRNILVPANPGPAGKRPLKERCVVRFRDVPASSIQGKWRRRFWYCRSWHFWVGNICVRLFSVYCCFDCPWWLSQCGLRHPDILRPPGSKNRPAPFRDRMS